MMIGNDEIQSEPLETFHVYIWKEEEPETVVDSTLAKPQPRDNHTLVMMIASSLIMALFVVFVHSTPISEQITLVHTFALSDLQSYSLLPVTSSRSIAVMTTGRGHQDATRARGYLVFYNGAFSAQDIPQGMIFTTGNDVQIVTDEAVSIPAGNPPTYGVATVAAHSLVPGAAGNIPAYTIDDPCCATSVKVVNRDFTGGRDARNFPVVTQRDIAGGALPLRQALYAQEQKALHAGPDATVIPLPCSSTTTSNHRVGEEAATVKVMVAATCSARAYSRTSLQEKARQLLHIPDYRIASIAVHVLRTTPTSVIASIQCTMLYNPQKGTKQNESNHCPW